MKTFTVPHLDRSITCKMASASARNEAGCAAVGAAKSAPIVLGSIVGVSRDRLRRQRIGWPLRLSGRKGADRTPRNSCQPADAGSDRRQGRRRVVRHIDSGCRRRSVRRPTSTDGFLNLLDGKRVERRPPRRYDVEPGATARTSKLDAAEFDDLWMKPFGAAYRAGDLSSLIIRHPKISATAGTRKDCQRFAPSTNWAGTDEFLENVPKMNA